LIELGANFDIADTKNQRPIYYAIQQSRYEMCKFLLDKGANLHMEDKKGMTPTHWAKK
jgi:ankyrin repeat protein